MSKIKTYVVGLLLILLTPSALSESISVDVYHYIEQSGQDKRPVRYVLSDRYLRIDYGADDPDYLLFNRRTKSIVVVNHLDKTILSFTSRKIGIPEALTGIKILFAKINNAEKTPGLSGFSSSHYGLYANNQLCMTSVNLNIPKNYPQPHKDFMDALADFNKHMGQVRRASYEQTPPSEWDFCASVLFVHSPKLFFDQGLPLYWEYIDGRFQQLLEYGFNHSVSDHTFDLPDKFQRIAL